MHLNKYGQIVRQQWETTGRIRQGVEIDKFIIMPNHLHGIIILNENHCRDTARRVPTSERFAEPVAGSIPSIVRAFKSAVTKSINILHGTPGALLWQPRYYDHVIRNEEELNSIREYILANPARWEFDRENPSFVQ
ncbi:transposase [Gemmatimonadota bacterium]